MTVDFFRYKSLKPQPDLQPVLKEYRIKQASLSRHFDFPDYASFFQGLIFNIRPMSDVVLSKEDQTNLQSKVHFVGQAISPSRLMSSARKVDLIALNFSATGLYRLTGMPLHQFTDKIIDAEDIFGKQIGFLYEQILDRRYTNRSQELINAFLRKQLSRSRWSPKPCIEHALTVMHHDLPGLTMRSLQKQTYTSAKTLERAFKNELGMTPKMYHRLLRFNKTRDYINTIMTRDWWDVVTRFGYYDHSHLISEFQRFSGKTPKEYRASLPFGSTS